MNPSTGRFVSMDSYSGSIYDPVSLHKYLYANGNPVMYSDPTGYKTITEMVIFMAAWTILGSISGAVIGGFSGGVIAKLSGATDKKVDEAIENGIKQGAIIGGATGALTGGALCGSALAATALTEFGAYFTATNGISTAEAWLDENYNLALYMYGLTLLSGLGTFKSFKLAKYNLTNINANNSIYIHKQNIDGLNTLKEHLTNDVDGLDFEPNKAMMSNIEKLLSENKELTGAYKDFYEHELTEGILMKQGYQYNDAHNMALEIHNVKPQALYSPEIIQEYSEWFNKNDYEYWGITVKK